MPFNINQRNRKSDDKLRKPIICVQTRACIEVRHKKKNICKKTSTRVNLSGGGGVALILTHVSPKISQ